LFGSALLLGKTLLCRSLLHGSALLLGRALLLLGGALIIARRCGLSSSGSGPTGWNVSSSHATLATLIPAVASTPLCPIPLLRKAYNRYAERQHGQKYHTFLHECLRLVRRALGTNHLSIKPL
jgi:hypothetical protein